MKKRRALPLPLGDTLALADWLEVETILQTDGDASAGDLERVLAREAVDREQIEPLCQSVMAEVRSRAAHAGLAYPFSVVGNRLDLRGTEKERAAYVFCLCLSVVPWETKKKKTKGIIDPEHLFEDLCRHAAARYLQGRAVKLSPPRDELPGPFAEAIHKLCEHVGEGQGYREQREVLSPQDDAVDVIGWRSFADQRAGKLVLFGQCASGRKWEDKKNDLQPQTFCVQWMLELPPSQLLKAMFVPHRVSPDKWEYLTRRAGIIFDRCRLVSHCECALEPTLQRNLLKCTKALLAVG
jgi:hypothetical protein